MAAELYRFQPLDTSEHNIRLVSFLPRRSSGDLAISIENARLDDVKGTYDAISYTWGSDAPLYRVWVDGAWLKLRENAWRFLRHCLEHDITDRKVWIDSICIDQSDNQEKASQVAGMGGVFHHAARVLIWLGKTSEESTFGREYLDRYSHPKNKLYLDESVPHVVRKMAAELPARMVNEMMKLMFHKYWTRLWIIQELALAQDSYLVSGEVLVHRSHIYEMRYFCNWWSPGYDEWIKREQESLRPGEKLAYEFSDVEPDFVCPKPRPYRDLSLYILVHDLGGQLCEDVRDKIYGVLGLTKSTHVPKVDYSINPVELLVQALRCLALNSYPKMNSLSSLEVAALMRALHFTHDTFLAATNLLPPVKSAFLQRQKFQVHLYLEALVKQGPPGLDVDKYETKIVMGSPLEHYYWPRESDSTQSTTSATLEHPRNLLDKSLSWWIHTKSPALLYCHLGTNQQSMILSLDAANGNIKIVHLFVDRFSLQESPILIYSMSVKPSRPSLQLRSELETHLNDADCVRLMWDGRARETQFQLSIQSILELGEMEMNAATPKGIGKKSFY